MPKPTHHVMRAAGLLMAANLASRVLGLLRTTVIAAWFGQNRYTDVYTMSFKLPDFMFFLLAGGVFSAAIIPVFTRYLSDDEEEEAWKIFSIISNLIIIFIGTLVVLAMIFARQLVPLIAPKFLPWQLDAMARLSRIILPGQLCFMLGALFMGVQNVKGRFLSTALGPLIYNFAIILGGWLGHRWMGGRFALADVNHFNPLLARSIEGLSWGVLGGSIIGYLLLPILLFQGMNVRYWPELNLRHPGIRKVGKLALPVLLGLSLPQLFSFINGWFATWLGPGIPTAIDRANQLMQAPLGIFAQAISMAIFPTMALLAAQGQQRELQRTFSRGLKALWFLTIPLSLLMIVLAPDIIRFLLQYGVFARQPQNAVIASNAFICYCIGLFAFSCLAILNRIFYAVHDTLTPAIVGTIVTGIFILLNVLLIGPFGYRGLAIAGSLAAMLNLAAMLSVLRWRTGIRVERGFESLWKIAVGATISAGIGWFVRFTFYRLPLAQMWNPRWLALISICLVTAIGSLSFLSLAFLLRMEETTFVTHLVLGRLRRKKL